MCAHTHTHAPKHALSIFLSVSACLSICLSIFVLSLIYTYAYLAFTDMYMYVSSVRCARKHHDGIMIVHPQLRTRTNCRTRSSSFYSTANRWPRPKSSTKPVSPLGMRLSDSILMALFKPCKLTCRYDNRQRERLFFIAPSLICNVGRCGAIDRKLI